MQTILKRIYKSSLNFLVPLTLEETYKQLETEFKKLVNADSVSIYIKHGNKLVRVHSSSKNLPTFKIRKKGFVYQVYKNRKSLILDMKKLRKIHPEFENSKIKSDVVIPLSYHNHTVGVLTIHSHKSNYFNYKSVRILNLFSSMASLAIRKAQLYNETKKALENRDLFISLAAHELRTPVTTIYGYAQLLYNRSKGKNHTEARWISSLHNESSHLIQLINDLLEAEYIKSGRLQYIFKECSLKKIIKITIEDLKFTYPGKKVIFEDLTENETDTVIGDFDKLLQAINNFLDNAAKFSQPDTPITIQLESKNDSQLLRIIDQGRGIPKQDLTKLFEGYSKKKDDHTKGIGLGLFLCKKIIDAHRGSIKIQSILNKGTIVEIRLPKIKI